MGKILINQPETKDIIKVTKILGYCGVIGKCATSESDDQQKYKNILFCSILLVEDQGQ